MAKLQTYKGTSIVVSYDPKRCIHAAECVRGNREVFDPKRRPWIEPDRAAVDEVADIVTRCPTGALNFERVDGGTDELPSPENTVRISAAGPVFIVGDVTITHPDGTRRHEQRVALCRCGASKNKPFCDNQHLAVGFQDAGHLGSATPSDPPTDRTALEVRVVPDGPLLLDGPHRMADAGTTSSLEAGRGHLCRCGASDNKPYCDGSHRRVAFRDP